MTDENKVNNDGSPVILIIVNDVNLAYAAIRFNVHDRHAWKVKCMHAGPFLG